MINRHILFFILSIGLVLNIYGATELRSTQMRTSDGLPNNSIRYIYQDTKGFLWLATLNGLSRYDGNSFLTFRPQAGDKVSLSDNRIFDLTEDKDGFLWISTTPELISCYALQYPQRIVDTVCLPELSREIVFQYILILNNYADSEIFLQITHDREK